MAIVRPLLASTLENPTILKFPVLISPKLDGIRCLIVDGIPLSRNGKIIPNRHIQKLLSNPELNGLDGELIVGASKGAEVFNRTSSGVMSQDGEPQFIYYVFDNFLYERWPFSERYKSLWPHQSQASFPYICLVPHAQVDTLNELAEWEERFLREGYEGVMIRRPDGPYKNGRSTPNDGILRKLKRFRDGEAMVLGIEEGTTNLNPSTLDDLGYSTRSTHAANMLGAQRVGTILGRDCNTSQDLRISPGKMTHAQRQKYFQMPHMIIGRIVKFKTFDYGAIDAPRFTTFQAFTDGQS